MPQPPGSPKTAGWLTSSGIHYCGLLLLRRLADQPPPSGIVLLRRLQTCENGLIHRIKGHSCLYQRHIHLSEAGFIAALQEAIQDALTIAGQFVDCLERSTREPIRDIESTIEHLVHIWNLAQSLVPAVKVALLTERPEQQETLFGLTNAFTNAAQQLSPDDRYHVEVLAGRLIEHGVDHSILLAKQRTIHKALAGRPSDSDDAIETNVTERLLDVADSSRNTEGFQHEAHSGIGVPSRQPANSINQT